MKKLMIALALALGVTLALPATADAARNPYGTARLEKADHKVKTLRLTYIEPMADGRAWVEFNNGSVWVFRACPLEDSPRCFWNAGTSGNHIGHSFVQFRGKTHYLDRELGVAR